jgi:hypothetical protein
MGRHCLRPDIVTSPDACGISKVLGRVCRFLSRVDFLGDLFRFVCKNVENAGCRNRLKIHNSVVCRPIRVGFEVSKRGRRAECGRNE